MRSKPYWGRRDPIEFGLEKVDFKNERLVLRRTGGELETCLQISLWKTTFKEDVLLSLLLVDIHDDKLRKTQTWLMRDINVSQILSIIAIDQNSRHGLE